MNTIRFSLILMAVSAIGCSNQDQSKTAESKTKSQKNTRIKRRSTIAKKDASKAEAKVDGDSGKRPSVPETKRSPQEKDATLDPKNDGQSAIGSFFGGGEKKSGGVREFTPEELRRIDEENKPLPPGKERLQKHLDYAVKNGDFTPHHFTANPKIYSPILLEMVGDKEREPLEITFVVLLIGEMCDKYNDATQEIKTAHTAVLQDLIANKDTNPLIRLAALIHFHGNLDPEDAETRKKFLLENQDLILKSFFTGYPEIVRLNTLDLLTKLNKHEPKKSLTDIASAH